MQRQHSASKILSQLDSVEQPSGASRVVVTLEAGDTAWDPSSTRRTIRGPARVSYTRYPDGGINARVLVDGEEG